MKKLTSLFILAAAIFMVAAGCGSGDTGASADAQPVSKETQDAVKDKGATDKPQVQAPDVKMDSGK